MGIQVDLGMIYIVIEVNTRPRCMYGCVQKVLRMPPSLCAVHSTPVSQYSTISC